MTNHDLAMQFFLQLAIILGTVRLVGILAKRIGQPQVVGEMIAGVMLGPSFLGLLAPAMQRQLFPPATQSLLYTAAQIGVVLYMFIVGTEFQVDLVRQRLRSAISVSVAGILLPFCLGGLLAWGLVRNATFFMTGVSPWHAIVFLGAAMSITAFPMLARIIYERGLTGTVLGTLTLAAGAIDDVTAWCLLAVVLAGFSGDGSIVLTAIGGGALYAAVVLLIGKPCLVHLEHMAQRAQRLTGPMLGFVLMLLMLTAWYTDYVRIYAVFGAFILGTAMPRGVVTRDLQRVLEPVATNFLLPLFFIYSGLNTHLALVVTPTLWGITILVMLLACVGKGVGCSLAAWLHGEKPRQAMAIGTLMNARGLMELILLNIGLERGLITPTLFAVMVLMAIVTTLMASPLFAYLARGFQVAAPPSPSTPAPHGIVPEPST